MAFHLSPAYITICPVSCIPLYSELKPNWRGHFYAPLFKKGAYCFALVGRSVDHVHSISVDPFAWKLLNLVSPCPMLIHIDFEVTLSKPMSNCWSLKKMLSAQHIGKFLNLVQWMNITSRWPLWMFRSHGQRSRLNFKVLILGAVYSLSYGPSFSIDIKNQGQTIDCKP